MLPRFAQDDGVVCTIAAPFGAVILVSSALAYDPVCGTTPDDAGLPRCTRDEARQFVEVTERQGGSGLQCGGSHALEVPNPRCWNLAPLCRRHHPAKTHPDTLRWIGTDRLMFSTDYPHWDFDDPRYAFKVPLTAAEKAAIFAGNAVNFYGLN